MHACMHVFIRIYIYNNVTVLHMAAAELLATEHLTAITFDIYTSTYIYYI